MRIQAFAEMTGLTAHTLRYYEKLGLLSPQRSAAGHRDYRQNDVDWVAFIQRLKATDMPLEAIQRYAALRSQGNETAAARRALLAEHAERLAQRLAEQRNHLERLQEKMAWYDRELIKNSS